MPVKLGIDIGGTFTDFVILDTENNTVRVGKGLTTPAAPSDGVVNGTDALLSRHDLTMDQLAQVVHGTTLVTNAVIERKGAKTGLITTRGFQDTLEIGREIRYDMYDFSIERPEPLVPRYLRREVSERISVDGDVVTPIDFQDAENQLDVLLEQDIESLAICLLHSYRNPQHEEALKELVVQRTAHLPISLSSEVAPEIREYDRTSTTVANAYVKPLIRQYLERLQSELARRGLRGELYIMLSSGGLTTVDTALEHPIRLIESGPAAGAIASAFIGKQLDIDNLLSFDMGGTTAKICLIQHGEPAQSRELEAARVRRFAKGSGFVIKVPVIEMLEIGAGGGSIAYIDDMGLLKVGPQSAGAEPGPACYGRRGTQPTVTDADLVLGYLDPEYFLGGEMPLDLTAAEWAIKQHIADPLGLSVVEAAQGINDVVNDNMANAARVHAAERNQDARNSTLVAFGGAGPVHAFRMAKALRMRRIICPPAAGVMSALGFLVAPFTFDLARSYVSRLADVDWAHLNDLYAEMEQKGRALLGNAGVPDSQIEIRRSMDARYTGQGFEVEAEVPEGVLDQSHSVVLEENFYRTYERLFSRYITDVAVEALTWRLEVRSPSESFQILYDHPEGRHEEGMKGTRKVYFPEAGSFTDCPVYDRYSMPAGSRCDGPAIVEEQESTVVIGPGSRAFVDSGLHLIIDLA
jgi:N-methylhydantoinase A